jgi:inorganic phosphate transporter, PiT family
MIILFISSGLFLGWSLGANDASNIFGSAVGARMISFTKAAIIASIFVILGAVIQGSGASGTLGRLGSVNAIGGSFTVALAAGLTVYLMTKASLPVSSTQAIVGAIIGWNLFTGSVIDIHSLTQILISWLISPILGAAFAFILYHLLKVWRRNMKTHLIKYEERIKLGLVLACAFGAYSLGANNIANVMGVFVHSMNLETASFSLFSLTGAQQLFLLGGIAIAAGILTYSKKVISTLGNNLLELSSEAALVVVISQSLVLFIFSSTTLANLTVKIGLPPLPLVPVSSTQVVVGAILGIGLYKGVRNVNFRLLGSIASGWITTPVIAGLIGFFLLFFMKNLFGIDVGHAINPVVHEGSSLNTNLLIKNSIIVLLIFATAYLVYLVMREKSKSKKINEGGPLR